jgi:sodium/hydrogen antiporter
MLELLLFGLTLFVAVLLSDLAERSILSTSVLFLCAGMLVGPGALGVIHLQPEAVEVSEIATLALFSTLFTDGMRLPLKELLESWKLPSRALLLGFPLGVLGTAFLAHALAGLAWDGAFLLAAVLAPTDPVFASALVTRQDVSGNLRHLLNVESGINDGLALPLVLLLLPNGGSENRTLDLILPLLGGVGLGIAVPWMADRLEKGRWFRAHESYRPMAAFAIALLVLSLAGLLHLNEFLAAFAAGVTIITVRPEISREFRGFTEDLANLLKFAAVFIFGAQLVPSLVAGMDFSDYLFVVLALVAVRPATLLLALLGSGMGRRERLVAAWFGPRGFASVVYAILVLQAGAPEGVRIFHLAALVIALSILLHSSSDVLAARWLGSDSRSPAAGDPPGPSDSTYQASLPGGQGRPA